MFTNLKDFCAETGFPARTLKKYLKEGRIPYHKAGRVYILDKDNTITKLKEIAEEISVRPFPVRKKKNKLRNRKTLNTGFKESLSYLKKLAN